MTLEKPGRDILQPEIIVIDDEEGAIRHQRHAFEIGRNLRGSVGREDAPFVQPSLRIIPTDHLRRRQIDHVNLAGPGDALQHQQAICRDADNLSDLEVFGAYGASGAVTPERVRCVKGLEMLGDDCP